MIVSGMKCLQTTYSFKIRFSEIDAMRVVWHGAYAKYFEDAREAFGKEYFFGYQMIEQNGYYAPIVDLSFQYKRPLRYGMMPVMKVTYHPTEAAKIVFDYQISDSETGEIMATGRSVQVFMNLNYELVLLNPPFYEEWKKKYVME
jgi:acyl-CoA thioester hydrolase